MNNNFIKQNIHLVLYGIVAGFFSSILMFLMPLLILTGMILGGCMAYSLVLSNWWSRNRLSAGKPPGVAPILLSSILMSTVALFLVLVIYSLHPELQKFWRSALTVYAFGIILPLTYHLRWRIPDSEKKRSRSTLYKIAFAGFVCGTLRGYLMEKGNPYVVGICMIAGLLGGLPYGLIWGIAVIKNDPAFSYERWRKIYLPKEEIRPEESVDGGA